MGRPLLSTSGIRVTFGPTVALDGADFALQASEVHALLGENGAGKSTLLKVIAGAQQPTAGVMELDGAAYAPAGPEAALATGIATIYQELSVLEHLTVAENVLLGREVRGRWGAVDRRRSRQLTAEALADLGRAGLDPDGRVGDLGPADRQLVEIARAVAREARVLVMDEPTSSLGRADVERLFGLVERLRERGLAIVYVSHFLEEVRAVASGFTVLRDGRTVATGQLAEVTDDALVRWMVGRELGEMFPERRTVIGEVVLTVRDLAAAGGPVRGSLELHRGEILGIGGLCGAGRSELLEAIFGLRRRLTGSVRCKGAELPADPAAAWRAGMGLLVEDRKLVGLSHNRSVAENVLLPRLETLSTRGVVSPQRLRAFVEPWTERLMVRCRSVTQPVGQLSGGNQQKVCLGRLLAAEADVLLLDEPTRGVDVQSRQEIYLTLDRAAREGAAVLVVSSQIPELLGLCDRVAVMRRGVLGPARRARDWTPETLLAAALQSEMTA